MLCASPSLTNREFRRAGLDCKKAVVSIVVLLRITGMMESIPAGIFCSYAGICVVCQISEYRVIDQ